MIEFSAPPTAWLVTYLVHSSVALALVWALERCGLLRTTRTREVAWRAALLGPVLSSSLRSLGLTLALSASEQPALSLARMVIALTPTGTASTSGLPAQARGLAYVGHGLDLLSLIWILCAALACLRLGRLAWRAHVELRASEPAPAGLLERWNALCSRRALRAPPLALHANLCGPVTLPRGGVRLAHWVVSELDEREQEALLLHELAHHERRDPLWRLGGRLLEALLWCQPLVRLARRRLESLAELAADSSARAAGADGRALAECLVACAARPRRGSALTSSFEGDGSLSERVEWLLAPEPLPAPSAWLCTSAFLGLCLLLCAAPGCDSSTLGGGESTSVTLEDDGAVVVKIERAGYRLALTCDVPFVAVDTTPELVALERDGRFTLRELRAGHTQRYQVTRHQGRLELEFERDDAASLFDEAARTWVRETLTAIARDTSFSPARGTRASDR